MLDIARCLNEVERIAPSLMNTFLEGYKLHKDLESDIDYEFFKKISFMDQYSEIHYVLSEDVIDKPDWMNDVIDRFKVFGLPMHFTENTLVSGDIMPAHIVDLNDYQVESWPSTPEGEERQSREWQEMYITHKLKTLKKAPHLEKPIYFHIRQLL